MTRAHRVVAAVGLVLLAAPRPTQSLDPLAARSKGRPSAPVTVYEMSDFQCPYCREFALGTLPTLEREYIGTGKVHFVYINFPLSSVHKNAVAAARVAMCAARQDRFWRMHDLLFRHQGDWAELPTPEPYLLALGDSAGVARGPLKSCVSSHASAPEVEADAERARRTGARSTPTFYIEGGLLEGAAPAAVFRSVLDSIYQTKVGPSKTRTQPR